MQCQSGEETGDRIGEAGHHILTIQGVLKAKRRWRFVSRAPHVHTLIARPDDPDQARAETEIGLRLISV
jgi:hypothetical protein